MKASIEHKLAQLALRLEELNLRLASETVAQDIEQFKRLSREHAELSPIVALYASYQQVRQACEDAKSLLDDAEMKTLAEQEIIDAQQRLAELSLALQKQLLPRDPNDARNVFLEIRAGTGGDESALFAADLFRMYSRFAERHGWQVEIISAHESCLGGYKAIIARLVGVGVYAKLKFESGGHRVQRVPLTEAQGRIHTSAATVAVMPEADEVGEIDIRSEDIRIDTFRASGAGGQHINKTDSAVRITHVPSGLVVECQDDRSQHKNKARAMAVLAARLKHQQLKQQQQQEAATRKLLIGSGDRSERIRTYNFPQGRVTDHRINLTLYKLEQVMDGDLGELSEALTQEYQAEQLAALADE